MRQSRTLQDDCESYIHEIQSHLHKISAFVNSLSETGEITKDTQLLIESVKREEEKSSLNPLHPSHMKVSSSSSAAAVHDGSNESAILMDKIKSYLPGDVLCSEVNDILQHSHVLCVNS